MFNNEYISYAIIAVGIFTVYMAFMHLFRSNKMQTRVRNVADPSLAVDEAEEKTTPAFAQFCENTLKVFKIDADSDKELHISLARAGMTSEYGATYFLFFRYIVQPLALLMAIYIVLGTAMRDHATMGDVLTDFFMAGFFALIGLKGTIMYVENRKKKRQALLLHSFPEVLDLLLVCIESGLGLDAALNRVCKEMKGMHPEAVAELDRTRLELTMLNDRVIALQNLADRTEIVPVKTLVSALIQTEKFGTSLVDTLRVLSEEQRLTRLFAAEQKAARIPVLITIPLIICILPAFIMIIVAPPVLKVVTQGGIFGSSAAFGTKQR